MEMSEPFLPAVARSQPRAPAPVARLRPAQPRGVPAPMPLDEFARLGALERMRVLDTTREEAYDRVVLLATAHFRAPIGLVTLVDEDRSWIKASAGLAAAQFGRSVSFCAHAIAGRETLVITDARKDPRFATNPLVAEEPRIVFYAGHPLEAATGERVGTLSLMDTEPRDFGPDDCRQLAAFAAIVSDALQFRVERESHRTLIEDYALARRERQIDSLTRLWSERAMGDILARERTRALRLRSPLSLIAVDLDGFRRFQEVRGQGAGDELLREVARRLKRTLRAYDFLGRVGGDEFRAVICHANRDESQLIAQRMLRVVAGAGSGNADEIESLTASVGVASCHFGKQRHGPTALVHAAGEALERARATGGNRTVSVELAE